MTALYRRVQAENSLAADGTGGAAPVAVSAEGATETAGRALDDDGQAAREQRVGGFTIPYRYASAVRPDWPAPAWLWRLLGAAEPCMTGWLERARGHAVRLAELTELHATDAHAPRFDQDWFPGLDGTMAYTMAYELAPQRVIEVGSGHSTRFLARALADAGCSAELTSIDPQPRKAVDTLCNRVVRSPLQAAHASLFESLAAADIAFIDGSHVLMPGTDVDIAFSAILPVLRRGVMVHIHDIFLPDPYPSSWAWRGYNEQHLVLALLGTGRFSIQCANAYLRRHRPDLLDGVHAPCAAGGLESSLWLRVEHDPP